MRASIQEDVALTSCSSAMTVDESEDGAAEMKMEKVDVDLEIEGHEVMDEGGSSASGTCAISLSSSNNQTSGPLISQVNGTMGQAPVCLELSSEVI